MIPDDEVTGDYDILGNYFKQSILEGHSDGIC